MKSFRAFIRRAQQIRLRPAEKLAAGEKLRIAVRKEENSRLHLGMAEQEFFAQAERIALSPAEKAQIRHALIEAMAEAESPAWWSLPLRRLTSITAALLIVTVTGTGVSFAAEDAMPGDLLYPVKIRVNEEVRMRLARTPEAKAKVAAVHAERRMHEAEVLASNGSLKPETAGMLAAEIQTNVQTVELAMDTLLASEDAETAASIGMELEASMAAHSRVLARLETTHRATAVAHVVEILEEKRMDIEETNMRATRMANPVLIAVAMDSAAERTKRAKPAKTDDTVQEKHRMDMAVPAADPDTAPLETLRQSRKTLRDMKEKTLRDRQPEIALVAPADSGPSAENSAAATFMMMSVPVEDSPPPEAAMMMRMEAYDTEGTDAALQMQTAGDREDLWFSSKVQMRMTKKKLEDMKKRVSGSGSLLGKETSESIKKLMKGAEQMLRIAREHTEKGDPQGALDASAAALKNAEDAEEQLKAALGL